MYSPCRDRRAFELLKRIAYHLVAVGRIDYDPSREEHVRNKLYVHVLCMCYTVRVYKLAGELTLYTQ